MSDAANVKPGDKVSWSWGAGQPAGTAAEVKEDSVTMETARGNEVKKDGEPGDPAVRVERSGHDVVKKASELEVEEKASGGQGQNKDDGVEKNEEGKDVSAKGKPDAETKEAHAEEKQDAKQEKKASAANGEKKAGDKKKQGSAPPPAKKDAPKKETSKPKTASKPEKAKRKAATESGEPRRSKRIRGGD